MRLIVYQSEARFSDAAFVEKLTNDFVSGLIANGTTTAVSFGSTFAPATDQSFEVFARRGFRAVHGMMLNDTNCGEGLTQDPDKALED